MLGGRAAPSGEDAVCTSTSYQQVAPKLGLARATCRHKRVDTSTGVHLRRCVCCCSVLLVLCGCGPVLVWLLCRVAIVLCCVVSCCVVLLCCVVVLCCAVLCCAVLCCQVELARGMSCCVPSACFSTYHFKPPDRGAWPPRQTSLVRSSPSSGNPHAVRCYTNVPTAAMFSMRHLLGCLEES